MQEVFHRGAFVHVIDGWSVACRRIRALADSASEVRARDWTKRAKNITSCTISWDNTYVSPAKCHSETCIG